MGLSRQRHEIGTSPHAHEQLAIRFLVDGLPDRAPFHLFGLKDLVETSGRRHEIDAIVLTPRALFVVEIKSHPAHFVGDTVDWTVKFKDGRGQTVIANPVERTNLKAKVLASALDRRLGAADRPHVQALVFLADPDASIDARNGADLCVVTRHNVIKALTDGAFPGATPRLATNVIDTPRGARIVDALHKLGLRNSAEQQRVAGYVLGDLLDEGSGWQDYEGVSEQVKARYARARVYLVPEASSRERREQLVRAAQREAEVLNALSDHPHVLRMQTSTLDGPGGAPCLVFDRYRDEEDLESFLRRNKDLPFARRVELVEQIGHALAFCHRKGIVHRGLDPSAVLVRRVDDGSPPDERPVHARLLNFQLASQEGVSSGTHHLSALSPDRSLVYRAPEVLQDPRHASEASDVFSLGAIAYRVFTGRPPGASLAERAMLLRAGHLSVNAARDDLAVPRRRAGQLSLDDVIAAATHVDREHRVDRVTEFVANLLDAATAPDLTDGETLDPLQARPGDALPGGIKVVRVLGSGATAKVLRVERDGKTYALKVALDGEHDARLRDEAATLAELHSERVVALHDTLTLNGRTALLLDDAGESLADLLAREGTASLDYARRWGEDLLLALETLEARGVQHRDIKPANLGVREPGSKQRRSLALFDFSLSALDASQVTAGTPAYRDPFLATRGRWDDQADRYAAAVSLHEMLTGLRPRWGRDDGPVRPTDALEIEAERFDAAVRDRLAAFFTRALAREASERFAAADAMRAAWNACFLAQPAATPGAHATAPGVDLASVRPDTALDALALSPRARNALDRSGIVTAAQLAAAPDNLLSAIRGIGRDTAREIHAFRRRLAALPALAAAAEPAFHPGYTGERVDLDATKIPEPLRRKLLDAGIADLGDLAAAPRAQVEHLAKGLGADATTKLRAALKDADDASARVRDPRTVEAWLDALFDPRQRHPNQRTNYQQVAWRWLGLDPTVPIAPGDSLALAAALKCTRQNVSLAKVRARDTKWATHPELPRLVGAVTAALDALGGAARIDTLAAALGPTLPHDAGTERDALADRRVEALVAVVAETSPEVVGERVHAARWIVRDRTTLPTLRALGATADALAARSPLPSSKEVADALAETVRDTALAAVPIDRLVALAAEASVAAARSARLELYPRGMDAARALALSQSTLVLDRDGVTEEALRATVLARYPEASALPPRPALDAVVRDVLQLAWDDARARWVRPAPDDAPPSSVRSEAPPRVLETLSASARPRRRSPDAVEAWEFDDALRIAARRRDWRVFSVDPSRARTAAERVAERSEGSVRSLDAALLAELDAIAAEKKINPSVITLADREGPTGASWARLRAVMSLAAERVRARWSRETSPLVLTDLGLAARYELGGLLQSLLDASQKGEGPAVFVVLPRYGEGAGAAIDGGALRALPVPTFSPSQHGTIPEAWIENRHRGEG